MVVIKVKWGKETFDIDVDAASTFAAFKEHLRGLTKVPVDKQKLMGLKPGQHSADAKLSDIGIAAGKTLMLIGTAEGTVLPTVQAAAVEDTQGGHAATVATSNGLTNIANTCYMNSAIQMLRTVPEVKECLVAYKGPSTLLKALAGVLESLDATREAVTPLAFWTALIQANPVFGERGEHGNWMQHDAQEALSTMLQHISEALPEKYAHLYKGSVVQTLKCKDDPQDEGSVKPTSFTVLTCNIAGEVQTLEAGLEQAFNEEFTARSDALNRDDAAFVRSSRISALPEYLFVQMVRFSWRSDIQKKAKILKPITFPITLDVARLTTDELSAEERPVREVILQRRDAENEKRKRGRNEETVEEAPVVEEVPLTLHNQSGYYELCGVISHKGRSADGGHYVYWGKKADQWLIFDDEHVAAVTEEDVKRLRGVGEAHIAYVLLYRSRDPLSKRPVLPL